MDTLEDTSQPTHLPAAPSCADPLDAETDQPELRYPGTDEDVHPPPNHSLPSDDQPPSISQPEFNHDPAHNPPLLPNCELEDAGLEFLQR